MQQTSEVNNLMVQYNADRGSLSRFYAIPFSPEKRERFVKFQQEYLHKLEALPFDQLSTGSRVDYILFKRNLNNQLRLLEAEAKGYEEISRFIPFAFNIYDLEKQRRRGLSQDGKKLSADMFNWQQQIRQRIKQSAAGTGNGYAGGGNGISHCPRIATGAQICFRFLLWL